MPHPQKIILLIFLLSVGMLFSSACVGYRDIFEINAGPYSCPANYVVIPHNTAAGTTADFCVAKYEMKCAVDATGLACSGSPSSQPENRPWVNITQTAAKTACANLGQEYHLLTNPEAMTISRNIEMTPVNWSSGSVNSGNISSGHNDATPNNPLPASSDADACSGTGQSCSNSTWDSQRRTHSLSNGEIIWDFSGNTWDWIDWQVALGQKAYSSGDGAPGVFWREWTVIDTNITAGLAMEPKSWQAANSTLNSTNGIGMYSSGTVNPGAAIRGASWNDVTGAGIYSLSFVYNAATSVDYIGFRCAKQ